MKKIENLSVDVLAAGMHLAVAVCDDGGRVLLPAGAELSASSIAGLERRGIAEVQVEIEVVDDPAGLSVRRARAEADVSRLFRRAGQGVETETLREAVLAYRQETA